LVGNFGKFNVYFGYQKKGDKPMLSSIAVEVLKGLNEQKNFARVQ